MKKLITIENYNKKMDKIIKMGLPISDTLVKMLEEASKYDINSKPSKRVKGRGK